MATQRFGLSATADNAIIDRVLAYLELHEHGSTSGSAGLTEPSGAPTYTLSTTGGTLPNGSVFYYRVSYIDASGLETVASDELTVEMPTIPEVTQPPTPTAATVVGSTLNEDTHYYALTGNTSSGQTALGPETIITTVGGQNQVNLALPDLPAGATSYNVWRMSAAEIGWTKIGESVTGTFADIGFPSGQYLDDPATQPPDTNYGDATNSVTITVPDPTLVGGDPSPVLVWRIYRTETSGSYDATSLLVQVATTATDTGGPLLTSYVDTGADTITGTPHFVTTSLTPSRPVVLPHAAALPDPVGYDAYTLFLLDDGASRALYVLLAGTWVPLAGAAYPLGAGPVLTDADGGQWRLAVDTSGVLTTQALP